MITLLISLGKEEGEHFLLLFAFHYKVRNRLISFSQELNFRLKDLLIIANTAVLTLPFYHNSPIVGMQAENINKENRMTDSAQMEFTCGRICGYFLWLPGDQIERLAPDTLIFGCNSDLWMSRLNCELKQLPIRLTHCGAVDQLEVCFPLNLPNGNCL